MLGHRISKAAGRLRHNAGTASVQHTPHLSEKIPRVPDPRSLLAPAPVLHLYIVTMSSTMSESTWKNARATFSSAVKKMVTSNGARMHLPRRLYSTPKHSQHTPSSVSAHAPIPHHSTGGYQEHARVGGTLYDRVYQVFSFLSVADQRLFF